MLLRTSKKPSKSNLYSIYIDRVHSNGGSVKPPSTAWLDDDPNEGYEPDEEGLTYDLVVEEAPEYQDTGLVSEAGRPILRRTAKRPLGFTATWTEEEDYWVP